MKRTIVLCALLLAFNFGAASQVCLENAKQNAPVLSDGARANYESKLAEARVVFSKTPNDPDAIIWFGRRTAYLGDYKAAIGIFTKGIDKFPKDARLYRHRGHRYVTLRCFDDAIKDFELAAKLIKGRSDEVEPDGIPNARNIPTSTLQSNIWYHLGLAYYLKGEFKKALRAYEEGQKVSLNNDMRVATAYWHYMTLRRMGRSKEAKRVLAPFKGEIDLIENTDYLKLIRLNRDEERTENLLAEIRGDADTLKSASLGYGIGNYFLYNGDRDKASTIFQKIVEGDQWASFGYIAAEAEINRRKLGR